MAGRPRKHNEEMIKSPDFKLKLDYLFSKDTKEKIAEKHHIHRNTLTNIAKREGWDKLKRQILSVQSKESIFQMINEKAIARSEMWKIFKRNIEDLCRIAELTKDGDLIPDNILKSLMEMDTFIKGDAANINEVDKQQKITTHVSMNVITKNENTFINPWGSHKLIPKKPDVPAEFKENMEEADFIGKDDNSVVEQEPEQKKVEPKKEIKKEEKKAEPAKPKAKKKKQKRIGGVVMHGNK